MFLLMLASVTFALNSVSFFFLRLLPPSHSTLIMHTGHDQSNSQVLRRARSHDGRSPNHSAGGMATRGLRAWEPIEVFSGQDGYDGAAENVGADRHETSSLLSQSSDFSPEVYELAGTPSKEDQSGEVDIRGLALLANPQFWQLFFLFGLLTGIGLMNIKWDAYREL